MNDLPPPAAAPLQFEKAEFTTPTAVGAQCASCQLTLQYQYFTLGTQTLCANCRQQIAAAFTGGSGATRLAKATAFGIGAGIAGAAIWYGVEKLLNLHIGLVAILIGYMVGFSVRKGSGDRGGRTYQVLAVAITYSAVCWSTIPDIVKQASGEMPAPLAWVVAFFFSFAVPFFGGFSALTLLIIAFGIWEAWRRNQAVALNFDGPFAIVPAEGNG